MRSKTVRLWTDYNPHIKRNILRFQSIWRGYSVRYKLKLCGKGVLKRSLCHNDEELVTSDPKDKLHPFDYFSIEEDGNVWWFDQKSMIEWSQKNVTVTNPFTRRPLSPHDMTRLNTLVYIRKVRKLPITHTPSENHEIEYLRDQRWLRIVQIMRTYDIAENIHPNNFLSMNEDGMITFLDCLVSDVRWWMNISKPDVDPSILKSKRYVLFNTLKALRSVMNIHMELDHSSHDIAGVLLLGLTSIKDVGDLVTFILNAAVQCGVFAADL
jgi:hypothetical protein